MKHHIKRCSIAGVLILSLLAASMFAQAPGARQGRESLSAVASSSAVEARTEKVRSDVSQMVAESRAGRAGPLRSAQFSPPHSNNLSKTAKIAIVGGVVVVIVAIIAVKSFKYDCKSRCVL